VEDRSADWWDLVEELEAIDDALAWLERRAVRLPTLLRVFAMMLQEVRREIATTVNARRLET